MEDKKIRIGIIQGDGNGIGTELILKTFATPEILELCTPIIYGSPKVVTYHRNVLQLEAQFSIIHDAQEARDMRVNVLATIEEELKVELGVPSAEAGKLARTSFDKALTDYQEGYIDVIVPAPIHEATFFSASESGQTLASYLKAKLEGVDEPLSVAVDKTLRVVSVTEREPIKDVPSAITKERVVQKAKQLLQSLKRDFRVENPRVAVLALNPSGADGLHGAEEQTQIIPAVKEMVSEGLNVFGPYQADTFWGEAEYDSFDGIVAMYDEQGILPLKALSVDGTLTLLTGVPLVCVKSDDEVSYDKAGKNVVDEMAFRHALFLAVDVYRNRKNYDIPFANPLKKLYHDKREEGEKGKHPMNNKKTMVENKKSDEALCEEGKE